MKLSTIAFYLVINNLRWRESQEGMSLSGRLIKVSLFFSMYSLRKSLGTNSPRQSIVNVVLIGALFIGFQACWRLKIKLAAVATPVNSTNVQTAPTGDKQISYVQEFEKVGHFDEDRAALARQSRELPLCAKENGPARSFLMVFMGHSGSSAILSEAREHPDVFMNVMELVDHQNTFNATAAAETTRTFFETGLRNGKVPGFKIRPHHLLAEPKLFYDIVRQFNTRIIWQYRKNLFKASVGEYAVRYLHDDRSVEGLRENLTDSARCAQSAGCSFRIDNIAFLHSIIKHKVHSHNLIADAVHSVVGASGCIREIPYEDYLHNREATMRDIFRFLGLPHHKTTPKRFKANSDNMCKLVENWQHVCRMFYSCISWQHMLDDARNDCFCKSPGGPTTFCETHKRTMNDF